jgi:hypothetical protein
MIFEDRIEASFPNESITNIIFSLLLDQKHEQIMLLF